MENKDKSWFKVRGYPHITSKNKLEDKNKITKLVSNPNWVAKYAFFPLLHKIIPQRRYKIIGYDSNNKAIRSHKDGKKRTRKMRPIHYATHLDSHIYGYYSNEIIQKKYEEYLNQRPKLSDCITAYRKTNGKNNIDFAKEVFDFIRNKGECCALAFDIESFFNHLNHKKLKQVWAKLIDEKALPADHYNVFKSITNFSYILIDDLKIRSYAKGQPHFDEQKLAKLRSKGIFAFFESAQEFREKVKNGEIPIYKNTWKDESGNNRGIVQGLPISAMLANLYLLEFDELMQQEIEEKQGGLYRRYSDDIVVVCDTTDKEEISNLVTESIKQFKLIISKGKTEECFFRKDKKTNKLGVSKIVNGIEKANQPLRYLGFEFYGDKTLIKSANVSKFYRRMKKAIKTKVRRAKTMSERNLNNEIVIFKRKLLRIYTDKGKRPRNLPAKRVRYRFDNATQRFVHFVSPKAGTRKYRGNFLNYVSRAARAMEEPAIEKQLQRHKQIFRKYLKLRMEKTFDVGNNWSKEETLEKW